MKTWLCVALVVCSAPAWPQVVPEREVEITKALYDAGNYASALQRARDAMATANFGDPQRIELHRIAGLAAFNLGDPPAAQGHFLKLLTLNPDYVLDPFVAPPPAVKLFEQVRKENADALALVRQQLALRFEQERRAAEAKALADRELEAARRRVESMTRSTLIRTVEKRSMLVNFLPFGAGQFQQGRIAWGVGFAVLEALTALTSLISYWAINGLYVEDTVTLNNVLTSGGGSTLPIAFRRIPQNSVGQARVWTALKYGTGIAFYVLWALGIGEALWNHESTIVEEHREPFSPPPLPAAKPGVGARLNIFPLPQGAGAGVTVSF
ncbi:MAG: hypothetical protein JNG84_11720 [Archangium sp.]|nr:hypothetical protein [Archangium sp.]